MAQLADLFGTGLLPGLTMELDVIGQAEERSLVAQIDAAGVSPFRFHGWTGKRMTASFGHHYDFDRGRLENGAPVPGWIEPLRQRAAVAAGVSVGKLAHLLLTRYEPGAGIGWHRDRPAFGIVVGISLGARAIMRFRRRQREKSFERFSLPLEPRSLYVLRDEARHGWEHSIAPMGMTRWSVTFRTLAEGHGVPDPTR